MLYKKDHANEALFLRHPVHSFAFYVPLFTFFSLFFIFLLFLRNFNKEIIFFLQVSIRALSFSEYHPARWKYRVERLSGRYWVRLVFLKISILMQKFTSPMCYASCASYFLSIFFNSISKKTNCFVLIDRTRLKGWISNHITLNSCYEVCSFESDFNSLFDLVTPEVGFVLLKFLFKSDHYHIFSSLHFVKTSIK